jgi:hypothetical protein
MTNISPQPHASPVPLRPHASADQSVKVSASLCDDVLIQIVCEAQPSPHELVAWQATSQAFRRVCTDNAVWAGRAFSPTEGLGRDTSWQDICAQTPDAKRALALIWRSARARSVPESSRGQLGYRQVAYAAHLNAPWLLPMVGSSFWSERPFVADLVRHGHLSGGNIPPAFAEDIDMWRAAFAHDRFTYGRLPKTLKFDPKIAWDAVAFHGVNLKDVPQELRTPTLCHVAIASYANAIHHAPEPIRSDRALWLKLLPRAPELLYNAGLTVCSDSEILRLAIGVSSDALRRIHWTSALRADLNFATFLMDRHPTMLARFDAGVRSDRTVALAALHNPATTTMVHPRLYDDAVYALAMVQRDGHLLKLVAPRLRQDDTILRTAITTTPRTLLKMRLPLRGRRDLVEIAIAQDGSLLALSFFKNLFSHDRTIVLSALKTCPEVFRHAAAPLRADREICLSALRGDPNNYQYLVGDLAQRDPEVLLAAGQTSLSGFQFASETIRDDRKEVLAAVATRGALLEFASTRLQADGEVVCTATENYPHAIRWASLEVRRTWRKQRKDGLGPLLNKRG